MTILDYINKNIRKLDEEKFNNIDSLILSQFCYITLKNIDIKNKKIKDLYKNEWFDKLLSKTGKPILNKDLLSALAASIRFRNIEIIDHIDKFNDDLQFSATTFKIDNDTIYIGFRGTDGTLVGWQEDFELSFQSPINSQIEALNYVNKISLNFKNIYIGGHSKGGNLAVYAGINCNCQNKIIKIFSHDGPGFPEKITNTKLFKNIENKIDKTIPSSSIVGILLETSDNYQVIKSNAIGGIMQHSPFSWEIENDLFICEKLSYGSTFTNKTINKWLNNTDKEERKLFVNTIFNILDSSNENSIKNIKDNWNTAIPLMYQSTKNIDNDTKKQINSLLLELVKSSFQQ